MAKKSKKRSGWTPPRSAVSTKGTRSDGDRTAVAPSPAASNRQARKEEARRQREILRRRAARRRALRRSGFVAVVILAAVVVVGGLILAGGGGGPEPVARPEELPGIQTDKLPAAGTWPPELTQINERIDAMGLPALGAEVTNFHIHQKLDLFIEGEPVPVPNGIGILSATQLAEIHTHSGDGIIHVEGAASRHYTLGQVFDVWGVRFTGSCLGGYCEQGDESVRVFVNGEAVRGDPRRLELQDRQVIVVTYGTEEQLPDPIPSNFGGA
jgi:hypothetical protein